MDRRSRKRLGSFSLLDRKEWAFVDSLVSYVSLEKMINPDRELKKTLRQTLGVVAQVFGAYTAVLLLVDVKTQFLRVPAYSSTCKDIRPRIKIPSTEFFFPKVEKSLDNPPPYYGKAHKIRSHLRVPVHIGEETVGLLAVDSLKEEAFSMTELVVLRSFSDLMARILAYHSTLSKLELEAKLYASFFEINRNVGLSLRHVEVITTLIDVVRNIFPYDRICVLLRVPEGKSVRVDKVVGRSKAPIKEGSSFPLSQEIYGWVIETNTPLILNTTADWKRFKDEHPQRMVTEDKYISALVVPICVKNECLGAIAIEGKKPNLYGRPQLGVLKKLLVGVGASMEKVDLYQRMRELATRDGLTGVLNYRAFMERLQLEIERTNRYGKTFALLMVDIDDFKIFNDSYGHLLGDIVLKEIAHQMGRSVRTVDVVARYGGEEFTLILVENIMKEAMITAERIRRNVAGVRIESKEKKLTVTVSVGIAEFIRGQMSAHDLIANADHAMYQAKAAGKNCVRKFKE